MFTASTFALAPFFPRVVGFPYASQPSGPVVYIAPGSTSIVQCPLYYPFDPRNESLGNDIYF